MDEEKFLEKIVVAVSRALGPEFAGLRLELAELKRGQERIEQRLDRVERRLDALDLRVVQLERRFETFEKDWRTLHYGLQQLQREVEASRLLREPFEMKGRIELLEQKMEDLEAQMAELVGNEQSRKAGVGPG